MQQTFCPFEFKADPNDNTGYFVGYGSTFGNVDSCGDTVAKGAFKKTIEDAKSGNTYWPGMRSWTLMVSPPPDQPHLLSRLKQLSGFRFQ